jgi:hypothetical protein
MEPRTVDLSLSFAAIGMALKWTFFNELSVMGLSALK